jgi:hypothetical protein
VIVSKDSIFSLRKYTLLFIILIAGLSSQAQDSYNYTSYGIGVFASSIFPYDDLPENNTTRAYNVTAYYNLSPYLPIGAEYQFGQVSGGSILTDPNKRQYDNHYKAFLLHGDIGLGQIIDYSDNLFMGTVKDFYVGTGIGLINNNMAFIQRTNLIGSTQYPVGTYTFPGKNSSLELMVPIRFGYEYKIYDQYDEPFVGIEIGYIHNITFGKGLDGYDDPSSTFKSNYPDQYRQIIIGIKVNFGPENSYDRKINY